MAAVTRQVVEATNVTLSIRLEHNAEECRLWHADEIDSPLSLFISFSCVCVCSFFPIFSYTSVQCELVKQYKLFTRVKTIQSAPKAYISCHSSLFNENNIKKKKGIVQHAHCL
uniref:Uncharacterized protein n=1 Tax=Daphnia magna TaxID=35525 RepID=A0A0P5ZWN2_9CRUS